MAKKKIELTRKYELAIIIIALIILIIIIFTNKSNNLKAHCAKAVCNEDKTICYNYRVDNKGKTIKTWEGNCSKVK